MRALSLPQSHKAATAMMPDVFSAPDDFLEKFKFFDNPA